MVTLTGIVGYVHEFDCITADITSNKHIPSDDGFLCGVKVLNGDILYNMETGDTYKYDLANKTWILQ